MINVTLTDNVASMRVLEEGISVQEEEFVT